MAPFLSSGDKPNPVLVSGAGSLAVAAKWRTYLAASCGAPRGSMHDTATACRTCAMEAAG